MLNEAIRLSIKFFEEIKGFGKDSTGKVKAPDNYKVSVMANIEQILEGGMSVKDLEHYISEYKRVHEAPQEVYSIDDILKFFNVNAKKSVVQRDPNNLIQAGTFYYHPALQVAPPPPTVIQLDDGTFESSYETENFFLEIKESFTYDDLVDYFYKVMGNDMQGFKERDIGAFKHILKSYDLDLVLYTIDESRFQSVDLNKPIPKSPFDIRDYFEFGELVLEDRKNTCYMEGLDRVIPRTN
jgi:hypothetical protein